MRGGLSSLYDLKEVDDENQSSSSLNLKLIIGVAVGVGVTVIVAIIIIFICYWKRCRNNNKAKKDVNHEKKS